MAQVAQTGMPMHNLYPLANHNISKHRKERKHGRECSLSVDDEEGHMVDFKAVCQVSNTLAAFIRMCYDDDFVSAIDEFLAWISSG